MKIAYKMDIHFKDGKVFNSMCTAPLPQSVDAYKMFIESNLGNPNLYPGTKKMENIIIKEISDLLHLKNGYGTVVGGGTEANITALWVARNYTGKKEIILTKSAHFSIIKAIDLLGMKPVFVKLDNKYQMDITDLRNKISKEVAAIVAVAGTTELGVIDPIEDISEVIKGNTMIHVDAAFGGFVIPFLDHLKNKKFDFMIDSVSSMTIDPHKMGMAPIPSGILLIRNKNIVNSIRKYSPYLTSKYSKSLTGTKASGSIAAIYTAINMLGKEGYRKIATSCWENTLYLSRNLQKNGFNTVIKPVMNILNISVKDPKKWQKYMLQHGYYVSRSINPSAMRFVIMPHIKKEHIDNIVNTMINSPFAE